jgi:hypothetical protein
MVRAAVVIWHKVAADGRKTGKVRVQAGSTKPLAWRQGQPRLHGIPIIERDIFPPALGVVVEYLSCTKRLAAVTFVEEGPAERKRPNR